MRLSSSALLTAALAAVAAPAGAAIQGYGPEILPLLGDVQRESVDLVQEEMLRQAVRLDLGSMRVLLPYHIDQFKEQTASNLTADTDVVEEYRRAILDMSPSDGPDADKLFAEIRRVHDLRPGPPLERVSLDSAVKVPEFLVETGVGADVTAALEGTPPIGSPEKPFGAVGAFARARRWNVDFYLGAFSDLAARYRALGYRRAYRLRAPGVGSGRGAYVLSPEPGRRPRLVYCEFLGQDLFFHARAQWAEQEPLAEGERTLLSTLTCPRCAWTLPGVKAMRSLMATVPYTAGVIVVGYDSLFADAWKDRLLGTYENDYWRLAYYRVESRTVAVVQGRRPVFGEILAASLTPLVGRGARAVYFAGPASAVAPGTGASDLVAPTDFATPEGTKLSLRNVFARRGAPVLFAGLPSPLLATREWLKDAKSHGVAAFDSEIPRLAEASVRWSRLEEGGVEVGIGAVLNGSATAKTQFRDAVLAALKDAARDKSR